MIIMFKLTDDGLYSEFVVLIILLILGYTTQKNSIHYSPASSSSSQNQVNILNKSTYCRTIGLTKFQMEICNQQLATTMIALDGLNQAIKECQYQFEGYRWNCSSLTARTTKNPYSILQKGFKETAFSYAIKSAGMVISIARACKSDSLENCGCDQKKYNIKKMLKEFIPNNFTKVDDDDVNRLHGVVIVNDRPDHNNNNKDVLKVEDYGNSWKWSGCSDNLRYGIKFSKNFLDGGINKANGIQSKTVLHNNQLGRMVVKRNMHIACKCHGSSGGCDLKTCWRTVPSLRAVGRILKEKFSTAVSVDYSNFRNSKKFNLVNKNSRNKQRKYSSDKSWISSSRRNKKKRDLINNELLYYEESPNFCEPISSLDFPGTFGRICNSTKKIGPNSCSSLCCGRGYKSVKHQEEVQCNCKFIWCCEVQCDICNNTTWRDVCK